MAVGMVGVGRPGRYAKASPHQRRRENIEHRLRAVRDQRVRVPHHATRNLDQRQHRVGARSAEHQPAAFFSATPGMAVRIGLRRG